MARPALFLHPGVRLILILGAWVPSSGAQAHSSPADASVEILRPLAIQKEQDLHLGQIVIDGEGGTVTIAPDGNRECSVALRCTGQTSPALFRIAGSGEQVDILIRFEDHLVGPGGAQMPARLQLASDEITLMENGTLLPVGARIEILPGQNEGLYRGQFEISLSYQ